MKRREERGRERDGPVLQGAREGPPGLFVCARDCRPAPTRAPGLWLSPPVEARYPGMLGVEDRSNGLVCISTRRRAHQVKRSFQSRAAYRVRPRSRQCSRSSAGHVHERLAGRKDARMWTAAARERAQRWKTARASQGLFQTHGEKGLGMAVRDSQLLQPREEVAPTSSRRRRAPERCAVLPSAPASSEGFMHPTQAQASSDEQQPFGSVL